MEWWKWLIIILVFLILFIIILKGRKINKEDSYNRSNEYETKSFLRKIIDACCLHKS